MLNKFLDFIDAPPRCLFCGEESDDRALPFCPECLPQFKELLDGLCPECGQTAENCLCAPTPSAARTYYLLWYSGKKQRDAVYRLKRSAGRCDFRYLAGLLETQIRRLSGKAPPFECLCFVPRSPAAVREYGYDQAKRLAKELAALLGLPCVALLKHTGVKGEQKRLNRLFRGHAVKTRFKANPKLCADRKLPYKRVLLVDDVATTGATLGECARILKSMGVKTVFTAVIARTPLVLKPEFTNAESGMRDAE